MSDTPKQVGNTAETLEHTFPCPSTGKPLRLYSTTYSDGNPALIVSNESGDLHAVLSVNLPEAGPLLPRQYYIKGYSENADLAQTLFESGILQPTGFSIPLSPWVEASICNLAAGSGTPTAPLEESN